MLRRIQCAVFAFTILLPSSAGFGGRADAQVVGEKNRTADASSAPADTGVDREGARPKARWADQAAALAEAPADPLVENAFSWEGEDYIVSVPADAKIDCDGFHPCLRLKSGAEAWLHEGHEDMGRILAAHRRMVKTGFWGMLGWERETFPGFVFQGRGMLIREEEFDRRCGGKGEAGGYSAWLNVTAGPRTFCARVHHPNPSVVARLPDLPSVLLMLKCAASLRLKTPYPDDPIEASRRMGWVFQDPAPKAADAVKKIAVGRHPSAGQLEHLLHFPAVEEIAIHHPNSLALGEDLAPLQRLQELRRLDFGLKSNHPLSCSPYFERIGACKKLEDLRMETRAETRADLENLHGLHALTTLEIVLCDKALGGLSRFAKLPKLHSLKATIVRADGLEVGTDRLVRLEGRLAPLAAASALKSLKVVGGVEDSDLSEFGNFVQLESLTVDSSRASFTSLKWLEGLSKLRRLHLRFASEKVSDLDGPAATSLPLHLTDLQLEGAVVTVAAAEAIGALPDLERLVFTGMLEPSALLKLVASKSLKSLDLRICKVPVEDAEAFKKARPDVQLKLFQTSNEP